jgi:hypothetical protein
MESLLEVMLEARRLVAGDDDDLLREIDAHIAALRGGRGNPAAIEILFLPTGPLQELSLSGGWGDEFCALADRFDALPRTALHVCAICGATAATLTVEGDELRRVSFTSALTQRATDTVRRALADAAALHRLDPELVPSYCPVCQANYCGEHWRRWVVFENDHLDSIRGTCPNGHERMLED